MTYNEWLQLGFTRLELDDLVEEQRTGYGGYFLEKQLTPFMKMVVYWDKLDTPLLQVDIHENEDSVIREYIDVDFAVNLAKFY